MANRKIKINWILKSDWEALWDKAEKGTTEDDQEYAAVPSGYEIYAWRDTKVWMEEQIAELEKELEGLSEPGSEELEQLGKSMHEYYNTEQNLEYLKQKYNEKFG